jgi:catechol-2,3-dioxygenase
VDLNHLHLLVKDLGKSKEFYCELFDFSENASYGPELLFLQNKSGFDLALTPVDKSVKLPEGIHFGFSLNSKEELDAFYQKAKELYPEKINEEPRDHNSWGVFTCSDPDGYILELYWDEQLHPLQRK